MIKNGNVCIKAQSYTSLSMVNIGLCTNTAVTDSSFRENKILIVENVDLPKTSTTELATR